MHRKAARSFALALGFVLSAVAVGMVVSRPRPLFMAEAQHLIDRQLCLGRPCPIEPGSGLTTEPSDDGIGFAAIIEAPRSHLVPSTPYGVPGGQSRYGVIGIASRTTLGWWWKSAVNLGIRPYQNPPNIVLVDDRYSARRIEWVEKNWDNAPRADLFAELFIARQSRDYSRQAERMMVELMTKGEPASPRTINSYY